MDVIEANISKQISTKANTFFNAIHSQDEVQEHVLKTCTAVKNLRKNLKYLDVNVILESIRVIKAVSYKIKLLNLIEKVRINFFLSNCFLNTRRSAFSSESRPYFQVQIALNLINL